MPDPWSMDKRSEMTRLINEQAERVKNTLAASHVVVIAFFTEGEHMHMQDGGDPPMPFGILYGHLATAHAVVGEATGEDVKVN